MRRILVIILTLTMMASAPVAARAQGTTRATGQQGTSGDVEQELIKLEQEWSAARLRGDVAAIERMLADDFIGTGYDGTVRDKARWMKEVAPPPVKAKLLAHDTDDLRVRVYGDTAVLTGRQTIKGNREDKDFIERRRFTHVYVKRQGKWQLVATQIAVIPKPGA